MIVTAWNNGSPSNTGAGYGVKLHPLDRDRYFKREWKYAIVELEGFPGTINLNIAKKSFWGSNCRELIHAQIGRWLLHNKLAPWPKGKPPKLSLEHIRDNYFYLSKY